LAAALSAGFALWWLMGGFRFAVMPLYAQEHIGLDSSAIGFGLTASAVANVCMLWPAGLASDRFGRQAVGVPAFCGLALAALALLRADTFTGFLLANAFVGAMYGCASTMPGTLLADSTPRSRAGVASGLAHLTNDLGNVLGPLAVGLTLDRAGFGAAIGLGRRAALVAAARIAHAPRRKRLAEATYLAAVSRRRRDYRSSRASRAWRSTAACSVSTAARCSGFMSTLRNTVIVG